MLQLTNREFGVLQESIDSLLENVARRHLKIEVETDFTQLASMTTHKPGSRTKPSYNPTFDPKFNDLRGKGFWFRLTDMDGNVVGCHADRIFNVDDFVPLMRSGRLWYDGGFSAVDKDAKRLALPPGLSLEVKGVVGYSGVMWLDTKWRGSGVARLIKDLSRALCMRNFETNYHAGLVRRSLMKHHVQDRSYGYPNSKLCVDGYFPPTGQDEKLYLCYIHRPMILDQLRAAMLENEGAVLPNEPHQPRA
ncbi:MAG: hypothetical protein ACTSX7_07305 [Alphaproteobacteria bacterium]